MSRVLITGSADGLGLTAGRLLAAAGHAVTLHARSEQRAADARAALPSADHVLVGDLSTVEGMQQVADGANALGQFDAVIHNAALGSRELRTMTADGVTALFAVNTLAPYVLTELIARPARLVYLSSVMQRGGDPDLSDLQWSRRPWNASRAYSDTKLHVIGLAFAYARRWPETCSNAVDPGWVATRMGGPGGSSDFTLGAATQAWLAVSEEAEAARSGLFFKHQAAITPHPAASGLDFQEQLLARCAEISGIRGPNSMTGGALAAPEDDRTAQISEPDTTPVSGSEICLPLASWNSPQHHRH